MLSVLPRFTDSDYPFGIFKLFLCPYGIVSFIVFRDILLFSCLLLVACFNVVYPGYDCCLMSRHSITNLADGLTPPPSVANLFCVMLCFYVLFVSVLCLVSCVHNATSVSGFSIFGWHFGFL